MDECPVDCIYEGARMLYIQPEECVDCDACVPVCPVTAIFTEDDVPGEWKQFTAVNAEWFSEAVTGLGSPGGAAQVGPQNKRPSCRGRVEPGRLDDSLIRSALRPPPCCRGPAPSCSLPAPLS